MLMAETRSASSNRDALVLRIVMEATGTYWMRLAATLTDSGYGVSVINHKQAHHFVKTLLKCAKTDGIDAQLLARRGALLQPAPWTPPPAIYTELQQRLAPTMRSWPCANKHASNCMRWCSSPTSSPLCTSGWTA
jgi:transposase